MGLVRRASAPFFKNGYLVWSDEDRSAIVIDPGDEVSELIDDARTAALTVHAILLTHAHVDHITGVGAATAAFGAPVWLHAADLFLYEGVVEQGLMFGLQVARQPPVDRFYEPGRALTFGRLAVDVLATPGHSPGGVCLVVRVGPDQPPALFVGDTLFAGSIGRTDLPGGDAATLLHSIRDVLLGFPDDTAVHPGHGPDTTIGRERNGNPFLVS